MEQIEKNQILKQIGEVLQFCQGIVSRLSSFSPPSPVPAVEMNNNCDTITEHFNDQIRELADSDKEAHKKLIETIAKFGDEEEEVPDDAKSDDDLWWDSSSPPPQYYTLVFDDDDVSLYSLDASYADFLLPSDMLEDVEMTAEFNKNMEMMAESINPDADEVCEDLLLMISIAAPNAIYDPNWREKIVRTFIDPQLLSVWDNAFTIFDDEDQCDNEMVQYQPPVISYHTIDIYNVNQRFINNIPKPNRYPVLGVSPDPDFYHLWYQTGDPYKRSQKFLDTAPFGSKYGYETNIGVVPPPTEPVHGYIWCGGGWKLNAIKPGE